MSKAYVEIDFFQMEKRNNINASSKPSTSERAPPSIRGIQSVVSRINPQLLKTVMAAERARSSDNGPAWTTSTNPPLPVFKPAPRCSSSPATDAAPLTIFYNGTVTTFDVPHDKAKAIIRMAVTRVVGNPAERPEDTLLDSNQVEGDLPIARRKSLQRFLEKRKERLVSASPYH